MRVEFYEPSNTLVGVAPPRLIFIWDYGAAQAPLVGDVVTNKHTQTIYQVVARGWEFDPTHTGPDDKVFITPADIEIHKVKLVCVVQNVGKNPHDVPAVAGAVSGGQPSRVV